MDRYKIFTYKNDQKYICLESETLQDCLEFALLKGVKNFILAKNKGYKYDTLEPLLSYASIIEGFNIDIEYFEDLNLLYEFTELKILIMYGKKDIALDFSIFKNLTQLQLNYHSGIQNINKCLNLKKLRMSFLMHILKV